MKKLSLKRLIIIFSLICSTAAIAWACGGSFFYTYWFSSQLTPETFVNDKQKSLIYHSYGEVPFHSFIEKGKYVGSHVEDFNYYIQDSVYYDWQEYLGNEIDSTIISTVLFNDSTAIGLELYSYLQGTSKTLPEELPTELIDKYRSNAKFQNFAQFAALSKQAEKAYKKRYYWDEEVNAPLSLSNDKDLFEQAEQLYNTSKDGFIKQRAWFLVARLYFYSDTQKDKCIEFFNNTEASMPKNLLYYRALSYKAGVYYNKKDYINANYYYAQVFGNCPTLIRVSTYSYHPLEEDEFEQCLALAKNEQDKISLLSLQGFYTDEQKSITEILKLDPQNENISILLSRMMTKVQNQLSNSYISPIIDRTYLQTYDPLSKKRGDSIQATIIDANLPFLTDVCQNNNDINKYTWYTSLGYMQAANGMHKEATQSYKTALSNAPKGSETYANQLRILKLHNQLRTCQSIEQLNDPSIIKDLNWLFTTTVSDRKYEEDDIIDNSLKLDGNRAWALVLISEIYNQTPHPIELKLLDWPNYWYEVYNDDFLSSPARLDNMINFFEKKDKTPIEEFIVSIQDSTFLSDLYIFKSSIPMWNGDIDGAKRIYEAGKLNLSFQSNPFNGYIKDDFDYHNKIGKAYSYNKFFATMELLEANINKRINVYENALLMGNAYYNISIYGPCRYIPDLPNQPSYLLTHNMAILATDMKHAEHYFEIALYAAQNDEQRAKCTYMLAKCERNNLYNINFYWVDNSPNYYSKDSYTLTKNMYSFKTLNERYRDTQYYNEVIKECGYFKSYVELHP